MAVGGAVLWWALLGCGESQPTMAAPWSGKGAAAAQRWRCPTG
ncbi:MAG: hypothetical protein ACI8S6_003441 [Myxococcota bacterium]|jgi:hypothetical protein